MFCSGCIRYTVQNVANQESINVDLANVQAPIETANGLPNACYIDPAMYQHEQNTVFRDNWWRLALAKTFRSQVV